VSEPAAKRPLPVVRLVRHDEIGRFNALLDEHHFLGHNLVGKIMRYVACEGDDWLALIGFGSPALSLGARDRYIGWNPATRARRLSYVTNNQRFCVLPDARRPNLASSTLGRTLRRLSADFEAVHGHKVLIVETFTDPSKHKGSCYAAANFIPVGESLGYGRANGSWVHHGQKKVCWLYSLQRDATAILAAGFDHPLLLTDDDRRRDMVDLNRVVIEGEHGLFARLSSLTDHRKPRGIRHSLASVLLVCVAAMLSGERNPTEIAEWAHDLPDELAARLHVRRSPSTGRLVTPSEPTVRRVLGKIDRNRFDGIVCELLRDQLAIARTRNESSDDSGDDEEADDDRDELPGIAVDGKSLRGAIQEDGRAVHLLAAMTHDERVVIGQQEVDHKHNEITAFRPLLKDFDISGALVTADAIHTQVDHARFLVEEKGADFLFFAKENQPTLLAAIMNLSEDQLSERYTEVSKGHGRIETRSIQTSTALTGQLAFPHVAQVVRIERDVDDAKTGTARHTETVYGVTSCTEQRAGRERLLEASRGHWGIENGLHWVRDGTMREDHSKVRSGSAPRALATIRNLVISVLHLAGATNIAKSLRFMGRRPEQAFTLLGL
jgi:predicted transposase YbfD/YdcC